MRILYVTDAFAVWGGLERVLADKINYLTSHYCYEICLLTVNQKTHVVPYTLHPGVRHVDLNVQTHQQYHYQGIRRLLMRRELERVLKYRMKRALEEIKPDIVICVKLDFVNILSELRGEIPLVVETHTLCKSEFIDGSGWLRRIHIWFWKQKIRKANGIVALTSGDAKDWERINKNVYVIPNMVHLNEIEQYSGLQNKSVIYVGRFSQQKDIDSLLQIWSLVHHLHPDWHLNIYGEGEIREHYLAIIEKMKEDIHVYEPSADIMNKYKENSILLLTSLYEPFGLVLPEAMSCGLPVIAFDCPYGPSDIITDGVDGFLIKNRDIDEFANKVCLLIENEELREKGAFQPDGQLNAVRNALEQVSGDYSRFRVSRNPRDFLMDKNGQQFSINQLSDGEKCYLTLVGDIARMLAMTNRGADNPLDGKGCILIDEVDLHLHPVWQSEILGRLTQIFKGCQFIITTHSPFVVTNVRPFADDKFFLMEDCKASEVTGNTYGKRIDQILLEFFHVGSLRNSEVEEHLSKAWEHLAENDHESEDYMSQKEWLRNHIDAADLEMARLNLEEIKQRKVKK